MMIDCVAIVSGGMDSVTLLHHLVKTEQLKPAVVSFAYGQKHVKEIEYARENAAMLGCEALKTGTGDSLAYRRPAALLAHGQQLAPQVTAMMDVSDGLLLDAQRMAAASQVTFDIAAMAVPIAVPEARRDEALRWGDDYQLLFTLPAGITPPVPGFCIGIALPHGPAPLLLDGAPPTGSLGYEHR